MKCIIKRETKNTIKQIVEIHLIKTLNNLQYIVNQLICSLETCGSFSKLSKIPHVCPLVTLQ